MRSIVSVLAVPLLILVAACADKPPTAPDPGETAHILWEWSIVPVYRSKAGLRVGEGDMKTQVGGELYRSVDLGPLLAYPEGHVPPARAEVFANATGSTFWARAQAPSVPANDMTSPIGSVSILRQWQAFRKTSPTSRLRYVITGAVLELIDGNGFDHDHRQCPWRQGADRTRCAPALEANLAYDLRVFRATEDMEFPCYGARPGSPGHPEGCIYSTGFSAALNGWRGEWSARVRPLAVTSRSPWAAGASPFVIDTLVGGSVGHARVSLPAPLVIEVPLDEVPVGAVFYARTDIGVDAANRRQAESYAGSWLRDPAAADGLTMVYEGLVPVPVPPAVSNASPNSLAHPPRCMPGVTPTGSVQFTAAEFRRPEPSGFGRVTVSRTGGSSGAVSLLLTAAGGTATENVDYVPVSTYVLFDDGEEGERLVLVPLIDDTAEEENETITLTLTVGDGCGTVGAPAQASLIILDDDAGGPGGGSFTIGGTVSGLVGSGLVLRLSGSTVEQLEIGGSGPFAFSRPVGDQLSYSVVVLTQPTQPNQVCTVVNGAGVVGGADVTDIQVVCAPPSADGGLDPGFGSGGKVTTGLPEGARRIALQPDGKIVAVGGRTLARYLHNGAPDPAFGSGGQVTVRLNAMHDELRGVAIQADGRIVVAGHGRTDVNSPTDLDVGVARFHADGSADAAFGDQGMVTIDFHGEIDAADEVMIQPDGMIVVAGSASDRPGGVLNADFALLRLTADGALDTGFGQGGKVMTNIAGQTDLPAAALLQPDGKIVLGGRVGSSGGASPDMALVRYNPDGSLDPGFGAGGIARLRTNGVWDEALGLALQPDGKLIAVGNENLQSQGSPTTFKVVRFDANGSLDTGFGVGGVVTAIPFSNDDDFAQAVAVQADGRIVVVGLASRLQAPDLAIARLEANGTLDASFGTGGLLTVDFFGSHDQANAVLIQPDGAIVAAGSAVNGATTGIGMVRVPRR